MKTEGQDASSYRGRISYSWSSKESNRPRSREEDNGESVRDVGGLPDDIRERRGRRARPVLIAASSSRSSSRRWSPYVLFFAHLALDIAVRNLREARVLSELLPEHLREDLLGIPLDHTIDTNPDLCSPRTRGEDSRSGGGIFLDGCLRMKVDAYICRQFDPVAKTTKEAAWIRSAVRNGR
jgi:hypothetical protein